MKSHVQHLAAIASKDRRVIIGLMSGTSLDGLDVALCAFTGAGTRTRTEVLQFETVPYDEHFKSEITWSNNITTASVPVLKLKLKPFDQIISVDLLICD